MVVTIYLVSGGSPVKPEGPSLSISIVLEEDLSICETKARCRPQGGGRE